MSTQQHGCRRAARLLCEQRERELQLTERLGLRLHLWMCTGCLRFSRQLDLMDEASRRWRAYRDTPTDTD
jgi:hypothetical protein